MCIRDRLLTLRGTPFLYQGEELGLLDAVIPPDRVVDPGGRDGCRAPIPWDGTADHGWPTVDDSGPWLPFPPGSPDRNHADLMSDESSILHLYRRLIHLRRRSPALSLGSFDPIALPDGLLGYRRTSGDERWSVIINFTDRMIDVEVDQEWPWSTTRVEVSSDGTGEGAPFAGRVGADQAVVIRH